MIELGGLRVILASGSPRRKELLAHLVPAFEILVSDVDETLTKACAPAQAVQLLALRKARAVACAHREELVIGADTVVDLDGCILGKPVDEADAARMLRMLSGRRHLVHTGVALCLGAGERVFSETTEVEFAPLDEREIAWYVSTREPMDKAGSYGIQGYGARFVRGVLGDYFNVMGLPVRGLYENLGEYGKDCAHNR